MRIILSLLIFVFPVISVVHAMNGPNLDEEQPVGSSNISWESPGSVTLDPGTIKALQQEESTEEGKKAQKIVSERMYAFIDTALLRNIAGQDIMKFLEEIERIKKAMAAKRESQMQQTDNSKKASYNDLTRVLDTVMNNKTLSVVKTADENENFGITLHELFDTLIETDCWVDLTEFFKYRNKREQGEKDSKRAAVEEDDLEEYLSF